MAPESERAKQPNGTKQRKYGDCLFCGFPKHQHIGGETCPPKETEYQSTQTPAPATCSEVVERLAKIAEDCYHGPTDHGCRHGQEIAEWIREQSPAILHSWRDRRVQELEKCLHEIVDERYTEFDMMRCPFPPDSAVSNAWHDGARAAWRQSDLVKQIAKDALANSEWREQIRKGANHE